MDTTETVRRDFGTRLYEKLAGTHVGKNLFLSPFSIRVALAMCAVGARGETRRVLADLIGAPESVEEQNRQYARLLKSIQGDGDRLFRLVTANALWGQQGYHFKPAFKKAVAEFYGGTLHEINFRAQPDEAAAATTVGMVLCAGLVHPPPPPKVFKADHPFLFYIRERETNAVLFSGRVLDPT